MLPFILAFAILVAGCASIDKTVEKRLQKLEDDYAKGMRQVMLQQFYSQEQVRSKGNSGLVSVRMNQVGTKNYYESAHFQSGYMAIHEHSNYDRTMGLGEINAIMNGVQFRTRHNDYKLVKPHETSGDYHATTRIPFPPTPKSVTDKPTVEEQIEEMREYFKAFHASNVTHRDYRPYFKPVLCYIEGAWTKASKDLEEPFESDRHHIDANSWFDLMEKAQFTSYTGSKSVLENFAYLPTMIYDTKNGNPKYAQWNYRIACHPIKIEVPRSAFVPAEDLLARLPMGASVKSKAASRRGRFILRENNYDHYTGPDSLLDKIMNEIPGKDNYQANLRDESMGMKFLKPDTKEEMNTGYYHRYYSVKNKDGTYSTNLRGFNDANLWVAQNTQDNIAGKEIGTACVNGACSNRMSIGYSYALPLEIVYMSPFYTWNPYNLSEQVQAPKKKRDRIPGVLYDVTENKKRDGGITPDKAFLGFSSRQFYKVPQSFFIGLTDGKDKADTSKYGAGVMDKDGKTVRIVSSAGSRVSLPQIKGIEGRVRLRYPIMPLHGEGSTTWKELSALREMVMKQKRYTHLYDDPPCQCTKEDEAKHSKVPVQIDLSMSGIGSGDEHSHRFWLAAEQFQDIKDKKTVKVYTTVFEGHNHDLEISTDSTGQPVILKCDGAAKCSDGHSNQLKVRAK